MSSVQRNSDSTLRPGRISISCCAPTGRHVIAQGIALGTSYPTDRSPERAEPPFFAPSGLRDSSIADPKALPWAITFNPVGASNRLGSCPYSELQETEMGF